MKEPSTVEPAWSPRRWVLTVAILFAVQAGVAWRFSDRSHQEVREETRMLTVRLLGSDPSPGLAALLSLNDPTRFVFPSRDGFSGNAWLTVRPLQHRSPGWSNPPQWLPFDPNRLLADFDRFGSTNLPERASVSDRLSRPRESRAVPSDMFRPKPGTRVTLAGDLAPGDLVSPVEFPAIAHAGLLAPTVVSVVVDQRGRVFQASLAPGGSSGLALADQLAIEQVRQMSFVVDPRISPTRNARDFELLRRGRLTVRWWTVPPEPVTNAPPAAPAAPPTTS
jgi:hypothetical protein